MRTRYRIHEPDAAHFITGCVDYAAGLSFLEKDLRHLGRTTKNQEMQRTIRVVLKQIEDAKRANHS